MVTLKSRTSTARVLRTPKKRKKTARKSVRRWSQRVTQTSDAMDVQAGVFTLRSAAAIARSLKRSAERSKRRKTPPFRSAMSMLTFELNRAGMGMSETRRRRLNDAKDELRRLFGREPRAVSGRSGPKRRKPSGTR